MNDLKVTATCLDFTKQLLHIGSLQHIVEHQRSEQTADDKARLLNALEPLQIIQARYPQLMLHRLAVGEDADSSDRWEATWNEWHTGVPQLGTLGREQARSTVYSLCYGLRFVCRWTDDERQALIDIGEEMIIFFGLDNTAIPRSADGLIWPFASDVSEEWGFTMAYTVGHVRLCRMRNSCNRHHETVDSPMGIICEIFFQLLGRKSARHDDDRVWEYAEMLGLDALLATHHVLNISIAHKRHGFQMRTGWPMSPRKLADRKDSLNNILVETIFTNRLKYCYPERLYPLLIKIMREVKVPQRIYDPSKAGIVKDGSTPYGLAPGGQAQPEQTDSEGDCLPGAHFNTDSLEVMKVVSEEIAAEDEEGDTSEEDDEDSDDEVSDAIESSAPTTKHNLKKRKAETEVAGSD